MDKEENKKKQLLIIRGPVGTGKTSMALTVLKKYPDFKHVEADMVFTDAKGNYHFDLLELGRACEWSARTAEEHMRNGHSLVVSNPFSQLWEMEIYLLIAAEQEYEVSMMDCMTFFGNTHNVEQKVIDAQRERWETAESIKEIHPYINIIENPNTKVIPKTTTK